MVSAAPVRRGLLVLMLAVGLGLAVAPAAFQMFSRAPEGGRMLDDFRPYMDTAVIDKFRGYLDEIGAAHTEARDDLAPALTSRLGLDPAAARQRFGALAELDTRWPAIDADMGDMLADMRANIDRFRGVDALPPFPLFPWFFVAPGLLIAGMAAWGLAAARRGRAPRRQLTALAVLGIGVLAAPAIFQMFSRAPGGARMIDDFRPLMTTEKVTTVQGYFLTIGAAEGQLRTDAVPAIDDTAQPGQPSPAFPAIEALFRDWPRISNEMAPMIGTMADNVDNFAAIDALPPFGLFPWFFVAPGVIVAAAAFAARRPSPRGVPHGEVAVLERAEDQELAHRSRT